MALNNYFSHIFHAVFFILTLIRKTFRCFQYVKNEIVLKSRPYTVPKTNIEALSLLFVLGSSELDFLC